MMTTTTAPAAGLPATPVVGEIEACLQTAIAQLPPAAVEAARPGPGRPRILPALCLWAGLLVGVLRGFRSQLALWRLLTGGNFWFYPRFPVTDQAVSARLAQAGTAPLERLFHQISAVLAERLAPYQQTTLAPFATEVLVLDETTLDRVARLLPALRPVPAGDVRLLPGKLAGRFDVRRQQWQHLQYRPEVRQNEKVGARELLVGVPAGSLLLADLGYFAFPWFDDLTRRGYWWVSRLRAKTSYTVVHRYYRAATTFDGLVWLGAYRADRAAHAVRLVQFQVGRTRYRYVTNVLDPRQFPLREIAAVYARRWDIELAFQTIKRHLGLHLLWSAKPVVIQQQIWAVLIIAQILPALRLEIAGRAGVDPFEVSLALLVQYLPEYAYTGQDPVTVFVTPGRALGFIRPSRRTRIRAPALRPEQCVPLPPGLVLIRPARTARRKCGPRPRRRN